ncbi:MAG TPA: ABC transporter permease [Puia sp.]|nr:ABC transporter permease [Puia sp.]
MLNSYIKIAVRNLRKQRFYTTLNVLGLSLGIAGGLLLFQFIRYHLSFDRYHVKDGQLYRAVTDIHWDDGSVFNENGSPLDLTAALQKEVPEIKDQAVLLKVITATVGVEDAGGRKFFTEKDAIAYADQHWFSLFDCTWLEGSAGSSLTNPYTAVITRRLADKYFGKEEAMGRTLTLDDKFTVTITGVLEDYPSNTDLTTGLFLSRATFSSVHPDMERDMHNSWGFINSWMQSFVWMPNSVPPAKIEAATRRIVKQHFDPSVQSAYYFHLQPVKDIHFDARYGGSMRMSLLVTLMIVGAFLVLIACFNFINLATAQSAKRAREIGTRKVLGGTAASVFWQFMTEAACMVALATVLSLVWVRLTLPVFHSWLQSQLSFDLLHDRLLVSFLLALAGMVTVVAGSYPALVLSRWKPVNALRQQVTEVRSVLFRKGLVIVQHVVVQVLIICTIIITMQIRYVKNIDPGFSKESVMMIPIPNPDKGKLAWLQQKLLAQPSVQSVSFCISAPISDHYLGGSVSYDNRAWENFTARTIAADANYLSTFRLQLLAGRNLEPSDTAREFLLNETLLHKFGFKDPQQALGHHLVDGTLDDRTGTIVGVVKDFNVRPMYADLEPVMITTLTSRYKYAAIKLAGGQGAAREAIQKAWQTAYPDDVFDYHYVNEEMDNFYHKDDLLNKLINVTAIIAIVISCLGLSGLISFFAVQRTKEIGVRKVLGASVSGIVYLLSRDFLAMVGGALLVAAPVAWYFMNNWLHEFAYRITIGWWVFVLAGLLSAIIAMCTVSYQAIRAAMANPADSLRSE